MKQKADHVLEECLVLLEQGQATLEECLHRYPDHADELRVLIPIALETRWVSLPSPSSAALETWERQMFAVLDNKQQRRPASRRIFGRAFPLHRLAYAAALFLVVLLVGAYLYFGAGATTAQAATLTGVSGSVQMLSAGDATWRLASAGQKMNVGDRLHVGSLSAATLSFPGGCSTDLEANTDIDLLRINIQRNGRGGTVVLYQRLGQTRNCVQYSPGYDSRFEVRTPSANVIARETEFTVIVEGDGVTDVAVAEGTVEVMSQALSIFVKAGEGTSVEPEHPPISVYTIPALTMEPGVMLGTEEPTEHGTPESGEPQETEKPEEPESPEPPEPEETEEPEDRETLEHGKPVGTEEPEEPEKSEEPEEPEESAEPEEPEESGDPEETEESEEPKESGESDKSKGTGEHETPEPGESHEAKVPDEHK